MTINEILQNLEAKSEENVEQKPTKWKEFKTKHRTTAKIIKVTKGVATGATVIGGTLGIDATKQFDGKEKERIVLENLKEEEIEELANELYDSLIKLQSKKEKLINQKTKVLKFNFLKNRKLIKKNNEVSQLLVKWKNEFDEISEMLPAIDTEEYIKNWEKNNMNNFDIQNNSELESNNEIEFGIDCLKPFKDEINLTNDKNEASTSGYKQKAPQI